MEKEMLGHLNRSIRLDRMRILQVCPKFDPAVASGSTRIAYAFSKELVRRGHDVVVYTSDMKDKYTKICGSVRQVDGIEVHHFPSINFAVTREMKFFVTPSMIQLLKKELVSFDLIHIHEHRSFQNMAVYPFARRCHIPYVVHAHGSLPRAHPSMPNGMRKREFKWIYDVLFGDRLLRNASKVIALNHIEFQRYRERGVSRQSIEIIPNGIDRTFYDSLPKKGTFKNKFKIGKDKRIVLYLGRIHETKGIDYLIKAHAHLIRNKMFEDVILAIAGPDDGYLCQAKTLVQSLGTSNRTLFTGFVSDRDKLAALGDAEVLVVPSFYGFPVVFLEACAAGVPIVTTALDETLDWIDDNVGYVTRPTPEDLARAIQRILSSEELHKNFSRNCRNIVKSEFSMDKVVDQLELLYLSVVNA